MHRSHSEELFVTQAVTKKKTFKYLFHSEFWVTFWALFFPFKLFSLWHWTHDDVLGNCKFCLKIGTLGPVWIIILDFNFITESTELLQQVLAYCGKWDQEIHYKYNWLSVVLVNLLYKRKTKLHYSKDHTMWIRTMQGLAVLI